MKTILLMLLLALPARADYIAACHQPNCPPCDRMLPHEAALRGAGVDVRTIDVTQHPDWQKLVRVTPTYLYIRQTVHGDYVLGRINGRCTLPQLQWLCYVPQLTTVGAGLRAAVWPPFVWLEP